MLSFITPTTILLLGFLLGLFLLLRRNSSWKLLQDGLLEPPTPWKWPFFGHLYLMGQYEVKYQAFSKIGQRFGDIVKLQLGNVKSVVVHGERNIREALVTKGHHFDSRPNFMRYNHLFCGNKENSLAFCDWSDTQKTRRDMLKAHTFPRAFTTNFHQLDTLITNETNAILQQLQPGKNITLKPIILHHCANIFTNHFCTKNFQLHDEQFKGMVSNFDEIFYEVNQGYLADFCPIFMPMHTRNLTRLNKMTHNIRRFILSEVIGERYENYNVDSDPADYVDSLIKYVKGGQKPEMSWETALFALEDIIGGHSAVGNFLIKLFAFLVKEPEVQRRIQDEIMTVVGMDRAVSINDRAVLPYTEATILEAIRLIASPIVPRVANQDSSINGYRIEKDTVLFLNNYELNMSEKLWVAPEKFQPERFLRDNRLVKPEHFLPFGGGRRSCMGYKMVQLISFGILGGLLQNFSILPADYETYKIPIGSLALLRDTFKFKFERRR